MENPNRQIILKLVFAGKHGAGKTSLLTREAVNQFTQQWIATIGVDFRIKRYQIGNVIAKAQLWDTAGQQRFRSIQRPYFKGAHAVLLCFDLSDRNSFQRLDQQIRQIRGLDMQTIKIFLIGCKSDLQPKVFTDQILLFSQSHNCLFFQTSAKQNEGVTDCFLTIVNQCVKKELQRLAFENIDNKMVLREKQKVPPVKNRCC